MIYSYTGSKHVDHCN